MPSLVPSAGRRRVVGLIAGAMLAASIAVASPPFSPASAVTLVEDPERNSGAVTGWGWHTSATPSTISAYVSQGNRIIDLELTSNAPTFSVAYVKNSGTYQRGWWWYYGQTEAQVNSLLSTNGARAIDIEPYVTDAGLRYAVVMVKNTGAAAKTWWWRTGTSVAGIASWASSHNARPTDIDRYTLNGTTYFTAIFVKNVTPDARSWWHYYNVTPAQIASYLSTNKARLIDLERVSSTTYDVIMVGGSGPSWWWYYGTSATQLGNLASQNGARIAKIEPLGSGKFAAVLVDDSNSETRRIRNMVASQMTGSWGFYLKRVGGADVLGLQPDRIFEPASMIKAVHHAHAMRQAFLGARGSSLTSNVTWRALSTDPARYPGDAGYGDDKNKCAWLGDGTIDPAAPVYVDQLGPVILKQMMEQSDNRTTDAVVNKYGFAALNATADALGMTRTQVNHRVGCDSASPPDGWAHNELTLRDAGRLYEAVANGSWVGTGDVQSTFWQYMIDGPISTSGALAAMIRAEAAAAGLTTAQTNTFLANVLTASKGGSYGLCPDGGGSCNPPTSQVRTVGGAMWVPFKDGAGTIVPRTYVYGRFFNADVNCTWASVSAGTCTAFNNLSNGMSTVATEMFRAVMRQALATW